MERNSVRASLPDADMVMVMVVPGGEPPSVPSGPVSVAPAVLVVLASARVPGAGAAAGADRGAGRGAVMSAHRSWPC